MRRNNQSNALEEAEDAPDQKARSSGLVTPPLFDHKRTSKHPRLRRQDEVSG